MKFGSALYLVNILIFYDQVKNWVRELKMMLGADIVLAIAGNKIDLQKDINVPLETAER